MRKDRGGELKMNFSFLFYIAGAFIFSFFSLFVSVPFLRFTRYARGEELEV